MASRLLAQVLVMGGTYIARAFVSAYQQALVNSAKKGGTVAANGASKVARGMMAQEEAAEILGVGKDAGLKDIHSRYDRLFKANDPAKGGSQYLQAKVHTAKTTLEKAAIERGEIPNKPRQTPSPPGSS